MRVSNQWLNVFVFSVFFWKSSGFSMEHICNFWHESGYIGDTRDCKGWGYCKNNKLAARGYCPDGYHHDAQSGTCKLVSVARCVPELWEYCLEIKAGEYIADPFDCRKYHKCDDEWEDDDVKHCADGYMFNNRLQLCVSSAGGCPQNNLDLCAYLPSGTTLGDPLNCGLYLDCFNGTGVTRACSAARYYNYKTGLCQTVQPEHCGESGFKPEKKSPPLTDANVCAKFYQSDRSGKQFISDALTCHGYYTCSSQYHIGKWQTCPIGTHFQWWSQKCVSPEFYSCPFDRCENLNTTFVSAIKSGCTEYIFCKNQLSYKMVQCPQDYPYFDEKLGVCVDAFPNHTVCFMDG